MNENTYNYVEAIKAIKHAILTSRYRAAALANRELLALYFGVGEYISKNSRKGTWGTGAIAAISDNLQRELPGLRGFSETNMKRMRLFYETWQPVLQNHQSSTDEITNRPLATDDLQNTEIQTITNSSLSISDEETNRPLPADDLKDNNIEITQNADYEVVINRPLITDDLSETDLDCFLRVGFTQHYEIIHKTDTIEERLFYIRKCAREFWSVDKLKYNLRANLYAQQGTMVSNFAKTITDEAFRGAALRSFKDEYLLDFVNIEDPDEQDERVLESEIVLNIKKFIMALGTDFSFIGNQHRIIVDEKEYFIDLLFFNRQLQSLVAIELKKKDFKPEYAGKMNFYLSALDDLEKKPHENPSIGIILCKEKSGKTVEFAFRDLTKPVGVATYLTANELPPQYRGVLPDAETLKQLL